MKLNVKYILIGTLILSLFMFPGYVGDTNVLIKVFSYGVGGGLFGLFMSKAMLWEKYKGRCSKCQIDELISEENVKEK